MPKKVRVAVAGANGYAGITAVHLLARHPGVELVQLTSRSFAGKPYSEVFPLLDLSGAFAAEPSVAACRTTSERPGSAAGWRPVRA